MSDASPNTLVYIVYARADLTRVAPVVAALRERGMNVYFNAATAHGSGDYVHESQQALRRATGLVVFYSEAAARSPWVEAETRAYQAQIARGGRREPIILRLDATPLPSSLALYFALARGSASPETVAASLAMLLAAPTHAGDIPDFGGWVSRGIDPPPPDYAQSKSIEDLPANTPPATEAPLADSADMAPAPTAPSSPAAPPGYDAPAPEPSAQPEPARSNTGSQTPRSDATTPQPTSLERVTFTAYHPREMQPQQWQPLVVYISLDDPAALALVAASAAERLAGKLDQFRPARSEKAAGLARGAPLRIVPSAPGIQFNPGYLDVTWQEDVQQHDFRMRAESAQPGSAVNGVVRFYQGMLLRAEVPISVFVGQAAARLDSPDAYAQAIARAYRRIFASYSHQDMPVVESCEHVAHTVGDQYLRDVSLLQSGQQWDPRLIQAINDADIFQLFWSKRAATSPFVAREWRHALMLLPARPNFIRPVYWTRQLYPTPPELNALHFQQLNLSSLGWGPLRTAFYEWRNG